MKKKAKRMAVTKRHNTNVHTTVTKPNVKRRRKGKRYKKRRLNKKRVFLAIIIFVGIIYFISNLGKKDLKQKEQTQETLAEVQQAPQTVEETNQLEQPIIETSEDEEIKALIQTEQSKYGLTEENFAFFYYRIEDKKYYFYNENKVFTAGSTVKVPVAMYYYDQINNGQMNLNDTIVYEKDDYEDGNGSTSAMYKIGQNVPISYLLKESIIDSDNTAVNILIKNLGKEKYRYKIAEYTDEKEKLPEEFYSENITTASFGYHVIDHIYQNQAQYEELINYMKHSSMNLYLKKYIDKYEVAHKYGSYEGYVHDYGFVLANKPYLIGIYTKDIPNADEVIAQISLDVLNKTNTL